MNTKNVRKQIQTLLVLVVLVIATTTLSFGAIVKGSTIKVITKDHIGFKGELLAISGRTLVLFDDGIEKEFRVDIDNIKQLTVLRKSHLGKKVVMGGSLGAIAATAMISGDGDSENDFRILGVPFMALLGSGVGTLGALFSPGKKSYSIENMSPTAVDALLTHLTRSTRENLPWDEAFRKGWFGRFRISWRPYFNHQISMNIKGNVQVPEGPLPSDTPLNGTINMSSWSSMDDGSHLGRIRVDYMLRNNFSLGFEYLSLKSHHMSGSTVQDITMTRDQKQYFANFNFYGDNSARLGLIGVNYDIPTSGGNPSHFRIETGIGLSFITMNLRNVYYPDWASTFNKSYNMVAPAFQVGLSMDFYPNDPISTGMYATFLYSPASFPGLQENVKLGFQDYEEPYSPNYVFTRDGVLNIPKGNFSMGGFSLGFFIRIR